jgi:hypothetical protein
MYLRRLEAGGPVQAGRPLPFGMVDQLAGAAALSAALGGANPS